MMDQVTGGGGYSYPESLDSSPRSRGGDSWDDPLPSSGASAKLRLMCSYGGRIVPRPTDKSLCYLGGDTRIVVLDRSSSLSDLHSKLSRSLSINNSNSPQPFTLKYQLPNEDLDSLISLSTDEDLDNMIDEYDRLSSSSTSSNSKSSRIRLFVFLTKPESANSSIGSLLDDSKSETWFVDVLNGAIGLDRGMSTNSASANLLGLDVGEQVDADQVVLTRPDSSGKLETNSSFGSTSSAPLLANLPPIRVRPDDRPPDNRYGNLDNRYGNLDEQFQQMNISSAAAAAAQNQNPPLSSIPMPAAAASGPMNPNLNRFIGSSDEIPDTRRQPPQPQMQQQRSAPIEAPISAPIEAPISDSRPVRIPPAPINPEPKREIPAPDPATTYRMQQVPVSIPAPEPEPVYTMPTIPAPEQLQPRQQPPPQPQPQQTQYIQANPMAQSQPHYVPIQSYYQVQGHPIQQSQQFDPSVPMYYVPFGQNPPAVAPKPQMQPNMYRTAGPQPPAQMVQVASAQPQGSAMGYHFVHHQQHPSQVAAAASMAATPPQQVPNYGYYTQAQTTNPVQYQTVISETGQQTLEMKQNRGN